MILLLVPILALAATISAHCTRAQLKEAVDVYVSAQTQGRPSLLAAHFDDSTWLGHFENNVKVSTNTSTLSKPLTLSHTRSIFDTTACATYTELVGHSNSNSNSSNTTRTPYIIGTQLRFANHRINKVDSIVTSTGDWLFNATGYAYWANRETWSEIPQDKRDTRESIKAAADAYCDLFSNPNVTVPWGTPCVRLEGGLYGDPGPNGTCAVGVPTGVPMRKRRYVVDEVMGAVSVLLDFGSRAWPDSHEFRVEGGAIRYVHTMTHCGEVANCGV